MADKPRILISKCIEHGYCRHDESQVNSSFIRNLKPFVDFLIVCPETAIGLKIPREPSRLIKKDNHELLVASITGTDISSLINIFAEEFVKHYKDETINGIILKSKSPSCGINEVKVYHETKDGLLLVDKSIGFFARRLIENYTDIVVEDEENLKNSSIRDHFLTRLYISKEINDLVKENSMSKLLAFHSKNKYLLMAYNQKKQKVLGQIVANHDKKRPEVVIREYDKLLQVSLEFPINRLSNINMLMHVFGYFKNTISRGEKTYFLNLIEKYKINKISNRVLLELLHSWVVRFDESYLKGQTIFNPYPKELMELFNSDKR